MGPGVYFIHSAALPSVYLSPCVYMSSALIRINTVVTLYGLNSNSCQRVQTLYSFSATLNFVSIMDS